MIMETASGQRIGVVQIAGLVARRILLETTVDDHLSVGQQYGIIRFGSRVDVWLPATTPVQVLAGQTTIAGETVIADLAGILSEPTKMTQR
jgi:phosphatidylserine decarboxylase